MYLLIFLLHLILKPETWHINFIPCAHTHRYTHTQIHLIRFRGKNSYPLDVMKTTGSCFHFLFLPSWRGYRECVGSDYLFSIGWQKRWFDFFSRIINLAPATLNEQVNLWQEVMENIKNKIIWNLIKNGKKYLVLYVWHLRENFRDRVLNRIWKISRQVCIFRIRLQSLHLFVVSHNQ